MRNHRKAHGATLPLSVAATIIIIIVGLGIVALLKIFGASREITNSTDAGVLNIAKTALVKPGVPAHQNSEFQQNFLKYCVDAQESANGVNISIFNRMLGSAFLIALNAAADANPTAVVVADNVIYNLEYTPESIGKKLKTALEDPTSNNNWAQQAFNQTGLSNTNRMMDKGTQVVWDPASFKFAYLESDPTDVGATNVSLQGIKENAPYTYFLANDQGMDSQRMTMPANMAANYNGEDFMRGYQGITIPKIRRSIYAVPTQPKQQPHLISLTVFNSEKYKTQPGADGVILPPNAFQAGSKSSGGQNNMEHKSIAAGVLGSVSDPSTISIPNGYLVIDNSLQSDYQASAPPTDTWEANEAGTGTLVYRGPSGAFAGGGANGNPLEAWLQTPRPPGFDPQTGPSITDEAGNPALFDGNGKAIATKADAARLVPFDTSASASVLCTDRNSDSQGSDQDASCVEHATPSLPDNLSPFNRAYHPNALDTKGASPARQCIASEQAKLHVRTLYAQNFPRGANFDMNFGRTGLRLYPNKQLPPVGGPYPYVPMGCTSCFGGYENHAVGYGDPHIPGKVTTDGTIEELFTQTTGTFPYLRLDGLAHARQVNSADALTPAAEVRQFIIQRMKEIKPNSGNNDFDTIFNQKLALGSRYYVYLTDPTKPTTSTFTMNTMPPAWARSLTADGTLHAFTNTYPLDHTMLNPTNEFGIHDHLFMDSSVTANAVDTVSYQPSCGATGLLGIVKFFEVVQGSGSFGGFPNLPPGAH